MRKLNLKHARGYRLTHKLVVDRPNKTLARVLGVSLLCLAGWQLADAAFIHGKAWLAQQLLQQAWQTTLNGEQQVKPWPWADTWPMARLQVPRLATDTIVLAGVGGNSLAFAPGHISHTVIPGHKGVSIISAHRDTHFGFLQQMNLGDDIVVTDVNGDQSLYQVIDLQVVDARKFTLADDGSRSILLLTTCYPFDAIVPGGPLRFILTAEKKGYTEEVSV